MNLKPEIILILLSIPAVILIYHLIPKIYLYSKSSSYRKSIENKNGEIFVFVIKHIPLPESVKLFTSKKLYEAGFDSISQTGKIFIFYFMLPLLSGIYLLFSQGSSTAGITAIASAFLIPPFYIKKNIEKREKAFVINAYKIYSFLHSQISSGIKATDAVRGMYEIVDDPNIRDVFIKFAAKYEFTLDIGESLEIIRKSFSGYDCEMLCVSIEQCIKTGLAGKTMLKMEKIMFDKYFSYLKKNSEDYRTKLLISALFAIVPLVLIFILPVLFDAFKGLEGLFGYG